MAGNREFERAKTQYQRDVAKLYQSAVLGGYDKNGNPIIDDPILPGYCYVRYPQAGGELSASTVLPYESTQQKIFGSAVRLGYNRVGQLAILGPDTLAQNSGGYNTLGNNANDPNVSYYVVQQRITTANSHPVSSATASMLVTIQNWLWIEARTVNYFLGGDGGGSDPIDLEPYIPAGSNTQLAACLFVKTDNTVEVITSTPKPINVSLDISDIQECVTASSVGSKPIWAWRLYNGQTGITPGNLAAGGDDFLDLRQFINVDSSSTSTAATTVYGGGYNYEFNGANYDIGFGYSTDGRRFTRGVEPAVEHGSGSDWDSVRVTAPYIVNFNGVLYMYFIGYDGTTAQIGLAQSFDSGLTWTKYASNPIVTPTQAWENNVANWVQTPMVIYDVKETNSARKWKMWYTGGQYGAGGIGYAYSADGLSWTKYASNPVLAPTGGSNWDSTLLSLGPVTRLNDTYYMFYSGNHSSVWKSGLATFTDPEGTYTRSSNNPLMFGDGIQEDLTAGVTAGDTTLAVTDATVFPIGAPVWVNDGSNHYLSYVIAQASPTEITLENPAPLAISSGGNVRSAAKVSVGITDAQYDGGWTFTVVAFQSGGNDTAFDELAMLAYADDSLERAYIDYSDGLVIRPTLAETQGTYLSIENVFRVPFWNTLKRFYAPPSGGGGVTAVTASAPLSSSGGATPDISHDTSGVTPGSYTSANITVDAEGHVTAASNGGGGGGGNVSILLDYVAATDIANPTSVSSNTWTDVGTNQTFTVTNGSAVIQISCFGSAVIGTTAANVGVRLVIDSGGTPIYKMIGGAIIASGFFTNILAGAGTIALTGLSAASHTVKLQVYSQGASNDVYCRPSSQSNIESLQIVVTQG